ncbi:MAG: MFS transporter [Planctomycetota bacterium]
MPDSPHPNPQPDLTTTRRLYPGYSVAAVGTLAYFATAPGQTFIISQLNTPLRDAFDIDPLRLNGAYTLATVLAALPLVYVGRLTDKLGPRKTMVLVALGFAGACAAMAGAQGLITAFIGFFLLRFLGQGSLSMVSQHSVAMWFHEKLGRVAGIKQVAVFLAWILLPQLAIWMIKELGWRETYLIFGAAVVVLVVPLALIFVIDRPEDVGMGMDGKRAPENDDHPDWGPASDTPVGPPGVADTAEAREEARLDELPHPQEPGFTLNQAMRTPAYWLIVFSTLIPPLVGTALLFDMQPIIGERLASGDGESSPMLAAAVVSAWTATMGIMALPSGFLVDRVIPRVLIPLGMLGQAIACALFVFTTTSLVAQGAMALFAVGQSLVSSCGAAATARYFGRAHHGAIRSSITRLGVIGTGLGPLITGLSADRTGGYDAALWIFAAMSVPVGLACVWLTAPTPADRSEASSG